MAITAEDIQRLEAELISEFEAAQQKAAEAQRQLEALELLRVRLHSLSAAAAGNGSFALGNAPPSANNGSGRDLRGLVLAVLHEAKLANTPLRSSQIAEACKAKGYPFNDNRRAMSSVTKVLTRLCRKGLIVRLPDGTYIGK